MYKNTSWRDSGVQNEVSPLFIWVVKRRWPNSSVTFKQRFASRKLLSETELKRAQGQLRYLQKLAENKSKLQDTSATNNMDEGIVPLQIPFLTSLC